MKRKNKGFTLIELLAVIVILGLLMAIAIPSITKYIEQSNMKTLVSTMDGYMKSFVNEVNNKTYSFRDEDKIYAVPIDCIAVEKGGKNPLGEWLNANSKYWACVLVQYDKTNYNYRYAFTFKDSEGNGLKPTGQAQLKSDGEQIKTELKVVRPANSTLGTEDAEKSYWGESGLNYAGATLQVLQPKLAGDGKTTCTLAQKGSNYADVKNDVVNIITFDVGSNTYQAIEGMTWGEWIDSEYNTCEARVSSTIQFMCTGSNVYEGNNYVSLKATDIISNQNVYLTEPM